MTADQKGKRLLPARAQPLFLWLRARYARRMNTLPRLILCSLLMSVTTVATADVGNALVGRWQGNLMAAQYDPIEVVFTLQQAGTDGSYTGTLDIPSQFRAGLPIDSVGIRNQQVTIRLSGIQVEYYGSLVLDENGKIEAIEGDWNQSGEYVPLRLTPLSADKDSP